MRRVYLAIENLALNDAQRAALLAVIRALGPSVHPQPACLCHWRTRLDGQAAIFEALFSKEALTIDVFKARLAAIAGVDPASIDHAVLFVPFGGYNTAVVTFGRGGVDYLRFAVFGYAGGDWPTWTQSGIACRAYLALHRAEWEQETE